MSIGGFRMDTGFALKTDRGFTLSSLAPVISAVSKSLLPLKSEDGETQFLQGTEELTDNIIPNELLLI